MAWLKTGAHESLQEAAGFIETIEKRQRLNIAAPEEVAWLQGWISADDVRRLAEPLEKSGYGGYLLSLLEEDRP